MKKTLFAIFSIALVMGVASCNLNDNNNTTPPVAAVGFVNASPAASVDIYLNGSPVVYGLHYGSDTGYYSVQAGSYTLSIDSAGTTTPRYNNTVSFNPSTTYSVFTFDSLSHLQTAVVADSVGIPSADSVEARFFNFSPNSPAIDFAVNGTVLFSNRTYNDISSNPSFAQFSYLAPGTYTAELRVAGTSTVLYSTSITVSGGKIYTFYAKGYVGDNGEESLSLGTVVHNE